MADFTCDRRVARAVGGEMMTCYGCRNLIQGSDGDCGCLKYPSPYNKWDAHELDNPPEPLYEDCYEKSER
jgi:hypothetical protein